MIGPKFIRQLYLRQDTTEKAEIIRIKILQNDASPKINKQRKQQKRHA